MFCLTQTTKNYLNKLRILVKMEDWPTVSFKNSVQVGYPDKRDFKTPSLRELLSCFCWRYLNFSSRWEPTSLQWDWRFSLSITLRTASPPAEHTGFPPKVLNWIFWARTRAISGVVTTAPNGKPFPIPWMVNEHNENYHTKFS